MMYLGIVGVGRVGSVLARHWVEADDVQVFVYNRHMAIAEQLADDLPVSAVALSELVDVCDVIFLTVADGAIGSVVEQIVALAKDLTGKAVVHTSGVHSADILSPLLSQGAQVGSLHPAFPFANGDMPTGVLSGVVFAVETEHHALKQQLLKLVNVCGGVVVQVTSEQKALYHASLVMMSNYLVTLYDVAKRLLFSAISDEKQADAILQPLLMATVQNIQQVGTPDALTGPLVRDDAGTVQRHLEALATLHPSIRELYVMLAQQTRPMLQQRQIDTQNVDNLLKDERDDAHNDS